MRHTTTLFTTLLAGAITLPATAQERRLPAANVTRPGVRRPVSKKVVRPVVVRQFTSREALARKFKVKPAELERPVTLTVNTPYRRMRGNTLKLWGNPVSTMNNDLRILWRGKPVLASFGLTMRGPIRKQRRIVECEVQPARGFKTPQLRVNKTTIDLKPLKRQVIQVVLDPGKDFGATLASSGPTGRGVSLAVHSCKITPLK